MELQVLKENMHTITNHNNKYSLLDTIIVTVVCGFNEQIAFFCERILPDICHWNSVVPKLNHFWRYCVSAIIWSQFCLLLQDEYY